jgi:hypothetical protein
VKLFGRMVVDRTRVSEAGAIVDRFMSRGIGWSASGSFLLPLGKDVS